jgi:hypothetical protein
MLAKLGFQRGYIVGTHSPLAHRSISIVSKNARSRIPVADSQEKNSHPTGAQNEPQQQIRTHPPLNIVNRRAEEQNQNHEIAVI